MRKKILPGLRCVWHVSSIAIVVVVAVKYCRTLYITVSKVKRRPKKKHILSSRCVATHLKHHLLLLHHRLVVFIVVVAVGNWKGPALVERWVRLRIENHIKFLKSFEPALKKSHDHMILLILNSESHSSLPSSLPPMLALSSYQWQQPTSPAMQKEQQVRYVFFWAFSLLC